MIRFNNAGSPVKGNIQKLKSAIKQIAFDHAHDLKEIEYVFVDDETILEINKQSLNHDYYTDIITFDYTENKLLEGEIYISLDRVKDNAKKFDQEFHVELFRVILHGVLHMVGYKDKSKAERNLMRKKEEEYLKTILI